MSKMLPRLAAILAVGLGASACSSVPNWVDPTTWFDGSPQTTDDGGQAPDLADIPNKPRASTPDEQKEVAASLAADRAQANYSAEQLRAGNEASAPPPADAPPPEEKHAAAETSAADAQAAASEPTSESASNSSEASASAPAPTRVAAAESPPALPKRSAPAQSTLVEPQATASRSDGGLGFKPSAAPPLDPSVAQFVSPSVLARYRQTASLNSDSSTAASDATAPAKSGRHRRHQSQEGVGGPEQMSGDVVANMDALDAPTSAPLTAYADANGNAPAAVVFFPGDGTALSAASRAKVKEVVQAFQANGSQGFIKVVGHSSSRTPNMPIEKHLELIFQRSQDRANAVAHELIREGIPANKVLVDAVGDSQPVYYESMPKGEEGNRRAEIFLQS
jgi:outer membrane protein OmpA-like peptidoglycan-associated protein